MSNIIILNGTSSSGKTSLGKALQRALDEPYMLAGIDAFLFMLPGKYLNLPLWGQVFEYVWSEGDNPAIVEVKSGPVGHRVVSGMHNAVASLARQGNNVILDHVLLHEEWLRECVNLFRDFNVLFVGVKCPVEVLREREAARGDRTLGQAVAQVDAVHGHGPYDVEVDTAVLSPEAGADKILRIWEELSGPGEFRRRGLGHAR
jgi:chloramphenicol 3-O phosphotransferase